MPVQVTVIGLGQIGTSIGLALGKDRAQFYRVGHDADMRVARQAEKMGAFDKIHFNLPASVEKADVVILALPANQIRKTMEIIARDLKPGSVLIDTSSVTTATTRWAGQLLTDDRYFVTLTPAVNPTYLEEGFTGPDSAHADLFQKVPILITCPHGTHESAINLAHDLASMLGGSALFSDPAEVDGIMASIQVLPELASMALLMTLTEQPGWRESRKFAGGPFAWSTGPAVQLEDSDPTGEGLRLNRENVVRMIDALIVSLRQLRGEILEDNAEELEKDLARIFESRRLWLHQRVSGEWEQKVKNETPTAGEMMGRLFWGSRTKPSAPKKP
jgi:prephenate dehydrogenase